jgi:hypothetical protein
MTDKIKIVHLEGASRRIDENTKIVRYMKLETLLLLLFERRAFIPSHATLGTLDRLETGILLTFPIDGRFGKIGCQKLRTGSVNSRWRVPKENAAAMAL